MKGYDYLSSGAHEGAPDDQHEMQAEQLSGLISERIRARNPDRDHKGPIISFYKGQDGRRIMLTDFARQTESEFPVASVSVDSPGHMVDAHGVAVPARSLQFHVYQRNAVYSVTRVTDSAEGRSEEAVDADGVQSLLDLVNVAEPATDRG